MGAHSIDRREDKFLWTAFVLMGVLLSISISMNAVLLIWIQLEPIK